MPGPLSRGKAWVERILKDGVPEVATDSVNTEQELNKKNVVNVTKSNGLKRHGSLFDAIKALPSTAGEVTMPRGEAAVIDETLTFPKGDGKVLRLVGRGTPDSNELAGTWITSEVTDGSDVLVFGSGADPFDENNVRGLILQDFALRGNGQEQDGIRIVHLVQNGRVDNVAVYDTGRWGFYISASWTMEYSRLRAGYNDGDGFVLKLNNGAIFENCHAHECNGIGFNIDEQKGGEFQSVNAEGCTGAGLNTNGECTGISISGYYSERCYFGLVDNGVGTVIDGGRIFNSDTHGLVLSGTNTEVHGTTINGPGGDHVRFEDCEGVTVSGIGTQDAGGVSWSVAGSAVDVSWPDNPLFNGRRGAVTDANGDATVSFDAPFSAKPAVSLSSSSGAAGRVTDFSYDANGHVDGMSVSFAYEDGTTPSSINFSWNVTVS